MTDDETATTLLEVFVRRSGRRPMIADAYAAPITNPEIITVDDAVRAFFDSSPDWLVRLMRARNRVVGVLGFEVGDAKPPRIPPSLPIGHRLGVFTVAHRSDDEVLLGVDDAHFTMRLSIGVDEQTQTLTLATAAYPTDRIGRVYLAIVGPFHRPVAASMAKRCASARRVR